MLPFELAEGVYTIRATTDDHQVESPPITVWATAVQAEETGGPIDEGDMLLAPMPTFLPAYPTSLPQAENEEKPTPNVTMPILIAGLLVAIIFFAVLRLRRRQS